MLYVEFPVSFWDYKMFDEDAPIWRNPAPDLSRHGSRHVTGWKIFRLYQSLTLNTEPPRWINILNKLMLVVRSAMIAQRNHCA